MGLIEDFSEGPNDPEIVPVRLFENVPMVYAAFMSYLKDVKVGEIPT